MTESEFEELEERTRLVSMQELCERLGVSISTMRREIESGRFPKPIEIGRSRRWRLSWIRVYLDRKEENNT